jgi:transposase
MPRPYSIDLRERAVAAVTEEGLSRHQSAARFGVGVSSVIRWVDRHQRTGSVAAKKMGGTRPKKIQGEHREWLAGRCRDREFTIKGLVNELSERGLTVDYHTMWTFVHEEGLSYKKNAARGRAGSPRRRAPADAMAQVPEPH